MVSGAEINRKIKVFKSSNAIDEKRVVIDSNRVLALPYLRFGGYGMPRVIPQLKLAANLIGQIDVSSTSIEWIASDSVSTLVLLGKILNPVRIIYGYCF